MHLSGVVIHTVGVMIMSVVMMRISMLMMLVTFQTVQFHVDVFVLSHTVR
jgi:hypothetical protein